MSKIDKISKTYTFDAALKKVTVNDYDLSKDIVKSIVNSTDGKTLYSIDTNGVSYTGLGGILLLNTLTLDYDTTGMNNNDTLLIVVETDRMGDSWLPNSIPLGSLLNVGPIFFINDGAGEYLSFSGISNNYTIYNDSLNKYGVPIYDGSDLKLKLHWRINVDGGVDDTVGWEIDYAIIKMGDNTATKMTTIPQQNIDVSLNLRDIMITTELGTFVGVPLGHLILVTLHRKGALDTFSGNAEILALEWVKI